MVISAIKQTCQSYYDALPEEIVPTIAKSALCTLAISVIFIKRDFKEVINLASPLLNAGVAALASTIHALMTPFFNYVFGTKKLDWTHEMIKSVTTAVLASGLTSMALTAQVNLVAFKLFHLISANSFIAFFSSAPRADDGSVLPKPFIKENSIYLCFGV
jgi:hypothetical protein